MMKQYEVFLDGVPQKVQPVRVSAMPMNMVWRGKQRPLDQTETAYFVSFDMTCPVHLQVAVTGAAAEHVEIRPLEKRICHTESGGVISFDLDAPGQFTVEVDGCHEALHVFANPPYVYEKRPDDIYFGPGEHDAGLILPHSGQRVVLDAGAWVHGVVYLDGVENVTVEGRGVLDASTYRRAEEPVKGGEASDGAAQAPADRRGRQPVTNDKEYDIIRAQQALGFSQDKTHYSGILTAYASKNITVDGIILNDGHFWVLILRNNCENVRINNIKIIGQWRYNSDGADLCASSNVVLSNSFIRSFDDSVVVRAPLLEGETDGCRNILVENNVLWCDWGKNLEIWSGDLDSTITNVCFRNNYLIHAPMTAISIATWFGSRKITVEDVVYDGVYVEHDAVHQHCVFQTRDDERYEDSAPKNRDDQLLICLGVSKLGKNIGNQRHGAMDVSGFHICYRHIVFRNVVETGGFHAPVSVSAAPGADVRFEDITIDGKDYREYLS